MKFNTHSLLLPLLAATALSASTQAGNANSVRHEMKLIMTMSGIPIGKMAMELNMANGKYSIGGSAKTYGATRLFSKAKGQSRSSGLYQPGKITPLVHTLQYTSKKKRGSVDIKFDASGVISSKSVPEVRYKPGTIEVLPVHLKAVFDPVTTSIVAVRPDQIGNGPAICNRTLPVYDGKNRFDLKMHFKGTRKIVTKGFKGISYVCAARYVPVAGHRPFKKHIKRLAANKSIEISLARISHTAIYGLIQFSVKTRFGKVVGRPSYFKTLSE